MPSGKKICQLVRADPAFQQYCAQCALFPSPTPAACIWIHWNSKWPPGLLAQPHWDLNSYILQKVFPFSSTAPLKNNSLEYNNFYRDVSFQVNGTTRIFSNIKLNLYAHNNHKAGCFCDCNVSGPQLILCLQTAEALIRRFACCIAVLKHLDGFMFFKPQIPVIQLTNFT